MLEKSRYVDKIILKGFWMENLAYYYVQFESLS